MVNIFGNGKNSLLAKLKNSDFAIFNVSQILIKPKKPRVKRTQKRCPLPIEGRKASTTISHPSPILVRATLNSSSFDYCDLKFPILEDTTI